jgi:hypothetical protein
MPQDVILAKDDRMSRLFRDRLSEPLHLNLLSIFAKLFGNYRTKINFDLVPRRHYAYGVLRAADEALRRGLRRVTVAELGVATGDGLLNLCAIAERVSVETGVRIDVYGFDRGSGLPEPADYRDHPELFQSGDFPMDQDALAHRLPDFCKLILGDLSETVGPFIAGLNENAPLGFVVFDIDYYSSACAALELFRHPSPSKYLPAVALYFDDIYMETQNPWCGELLAIEEFNRSEKFRKIAVDRFLRSRRVFKSARWIDQIYLLHVLDHPERTNTRTGRAVKSYELLRENTETNKLKRTA